MSRIRTTRQARRIRPMARVLAARQRFWKVAEVLLIKRPFNAYDHPSEYGQLRGEYMIALIEKQAAEIHYIAQGGDLKQLRGARMLEEGRP